MAKTVTYHSNNSGGGWWLADDDWRKLEDTGWTVEWRDERWLGALANYAHRTLKEGETVETVVREWEATTGQSAAAIGCNCCGPPHDFSWEDDETGDSGYVTLIEPQHGELRFD